MSDDSFIREVDDELRNDQMQRLWDRYKYLVIGGAVAIVVATAGYRGWEYYKNSVAAASGDRFMAAVELSNDGKHNDAIAQLEALALDGSGQYPALAKLRIASEFALRGDEKLAIETYDKLSSDPDVNPAMQQIAILRAGILAVDNNDLEDVTKRLQPLSNPGLPFRHSAREALGLANFKAGKLKEALRWFDAIASDADAGAGIRSRANIMIELLAGKGISVEKAKS